MKQGLTEAICVLDMTGSMQPQTKDTIGGFNTFIADQKKIPGECSVTVVFFNSSEYKKWLDSRPLAEVPDLTERDYQARMNTPLYDAIGRTIEEMGEKFDMRPEEERPEKVLFVIMTDGEENWSKNFSKAKVIEMIAQQRQEWNWEFIFLGADLDSFGQAKTLGIPTTHAANYCGNTKQGYGLVSRALKSCRTGKDIDLKDV